MRQQALAFLAGPLALLRIAPARAVFLLFLVFLFTAATQIGGLALWLCVPAFSRVRQRLARRGPMLRVSLNAAIFAAVYLAFSLAAIPLAGLAGRAPLPCGWAGDGTFAPRTILTCLANRHYAALSAKQALQQVNERVSAENRGISIAYLDAGFPFFDGFPMLPHLSHRDGRQIDLALIHDDGAASPSPIGYWGYQSPRPGDPMPCMGREGWLRWNLEWLQPLFGSAPLDESAMRDLFDGLAESTAVERILIEPHLRTRLKLDHPKIGFQGCKAARHDDHIHVAFRR